MALRRIRGNIVRAKCDLLTNLKYFVNCIKTCVQTDQSITMHKIELWSFQSISNVTLKSAQYEIEKLSQDSREQFRNRIRR